METVVIKIENTYISLAHVKKSGSGFRVMRIRRAPLPESLCGEEAGRQPDLVAAVLIAALEGGEFPVKHLSLYLGAGTELFSEYRYNEALDYTARRQRRQQTEDALLADASAPLYRVKYYLYDGADNGLAASAIFAADTVFCDRLRSALAKDGFKVAIISSSLAAFAETAKTVSDLGDRVLVLSAEKNEIQAALFDHNRLLRLARFAQGVADESSVALISPLINNETKIALCGQESQDARFREQLKQTGALAVGSVNTKMKYASEHIVPSDELAYQSALYPGVFAAAAFPGTEGETAYFAEARDVQKIGAGLRAACIITLIVAVFACALSPATFIRAEREKEANLVRLEEPFYAAAAAKLAYYRPLIAEYTELIEAEESVPARDPSHAGLLEATITGLLIDTQIEEMYYEKGKGILVDFTTNDIEAFDVKKDALSADEGILLYEAKAREEIDEDVWRIQLRVTLTQTAWEAQ